MTTFEARLDRRQKTVEQELAELYKEFELLKQEFNLFRREVLELKNTGYIYGPIVNK